MCFCVFGTRLPERLDRLLRLATPKTLPRQLDSVLLVARLPRHEQERRRVQDDKVLDRVRGRQFVVEEVEQRERVFERGAACDGRERSRVQAKDGRVDGSFGDSSVFQIPDLRGDKALVVSTTERTPRPPQVVHQKRNVQKSPQPD